MADITLGALTVVDAVLSDNAAGWGGAIAMPGGRYTLYISSLLDKGADNVECQRHCIEGSEKAPCASILSVTPDSEGALQPPLR